MTYSTRLENFGLPKNQNPRNPQNLRNPLPKNRNPQSPRNPLKTQMRRRLNIEIHEIHKLYEIHLPKHRNPQHLSIRYTKSTI